MSKHHDGAPGAEGGRRHHEGGSEHRADWPFADDRGFRGPRSGRGWPQGEGRDRRPARGEHGGRGGRGGPGGPWGGPWGGRGFGGPRRPRGDVRLAILALLAIEPMHGYQMIQEISERSGGRWQPSPGSVYPTLQALEDEGLVTADQSEGKRVFTLTDQGREQVENLGDRAKAPWDLGRESAVGARALAEQMGQLAAAFTQVLRTGSPDQHDRAQQVLDQARRALYQILADGPDPAANTADTTAGGRVHAAGVAPPLRRSRAPSLSIGDQVPGFREAVR